MPTVYLSPSLQEWNQYVNGGNEEFYMNEIVDEMIPLLENSNINVFRNDITKNLRYAIDYSNRVNPELHVAIHSNSSPQNLAGILKGTDIYYYSGSVRSKRAANIFANNFKEIYPDPNNVETIATTSIAELTQVNSPAILIEIAYHDNPQDANWIKNNISNIARNLSESIADYFGVPFVG